jgi:hypothetical protein
MRLEAWHKRIDIVIWLAFFYLASVPIHEFIHWQVGEATGGEISQVTYADWFSGLTSYTQAPDPLWSFYIAGGVGTGLIFFILGWRALSTPTRWDYSIMFSAFLVGGAQFGYGVGELSLAFESSDNWFPLAAAFGTIIGAIIPIMLFGPRVNRWIST